MRASLVALVALLAPAAARAEKAWLFEPGQTLVAVEHGPQGARTSAVSARLSGRVRETDNGAIKVELRLPISSFAAGAPDRDARFREVSEAEVFPEVVYEGTSDPPGKIGTILHGTLTFHGVSRPLDVPVVLSRSGPIVFAHATFTVRLVEYGLSLPSGSDELRVQVDAALRPAAASIASH